MKKVKLLFVQESLRLAGSEKSMVSLLRNLNKNKYDIDIQLMSYGGELEKEVPSWINFLPPLDYKIFSSKSLINNFLSIRSVKEFKYLVARINYSLAIRKGKTNHSEKAMMFWKTIGAIIPKAEKEYDVAIGYAQGFSTFYAMDNVKATKKICWVNANLVLKGKSKSFYEDYYSKYDRVVCVTQKTKEILLNQLSPLKNLIVINDIIDYNDIIEAARQKIPIFNDKTKNLLTVSRLEKFSKGMDILLEAGKTLKTKGFNFHWYIIGAGDYRFEMEKFLEENNLGNNFTFLGTSSNPYPYFKAADLYVQTSRHEGYGLAIAEARLLNIPLVTTRFDTVGVQIFHEKNGLITDLNGQSVAEGIIRLMKDKELYHSIRENLKKEPKENLESVEKFDMMIERLLDDM